jgi:thymidylate synthase
LVDNGCHIWDGDAYKNYLSKVQNYADSLSVPDDISEFKGVIDSLNKQIKSSVLTQEEFINKIKTNDEFAKKWGELGPIYGKQWRSWSRPTIQLGKLIPQHFDQIANLINDLKTNPDSRRLMVNAWNVGELDQCVLPPCHYGFQVYTRELSSQERKNIYDKSSWIKDVFPTDENGWNSLFDDYNSPTRALSLMWNQRSCDVGLGIPFNIASYGLLLEIIARYVDMIPYELIGNLGDCHIYSNHIDGVKEQLTRKPYPLPTLKINSGNENWHLLEVDEIINSFDPDLTFKVENYQSHPSIKLPLSN